MPPRRVQPLPRNPEIPYDLDDLNPGSINKLVQKFKLNIDIPKNMNRDQKKIILRELLSVLKINNRNGHVYFKTDKTNNKAEFLVFTGAIVDANQNIAVNNNNNPLILLPLI